MDTRGSFLGIDLTINLHLVARSRMREAVPPLSQYAFMEWCSVKVERGHIFIIAQFLSNLRIHRRLKVRSVLGDP
jgi:hypothetical protein